VAAGIDWAWELSVLPVAFMILAGGLLGSRKSRRPSRRDGLIARSILVGLSVIAIAVIALPLLAAESVRNSEADARGGNLQAALDAARHAHDLQPYAGAPLLQQALVLELMHNYGTAANAARDATRADAKNWRPWLVLSRLEAERDHQRDAVSAYLRARSLNPRSPLFPGTQ
jgi:tetratricopeptide (TPR) repeat protein